jgi:hypothetical protein
MSTRKLELKPEQLQALSLQRGDTFAGAVMPDGRCVVQVSHEDRTNAAEWCQFLEGWQAEVKDTSDWTDEQIDNARYDYLMEKHVYRHMPRP